MTSTERLLLDCLHQDPARLDPDALSRLTGQDWDALLDLARRQHVRPLIFRRLTQADVDDAVPEPVLESLRAACRRIGRRNLALHAELARLLEILGGAGIPVILLKGMHVASALYGNLARREIGDMDLLVRGGTSHARSFFRLTIYDARIPEYPPPYGAGGLSMSYGART